MKIIRCFTLLAVVVSVMEGMEAKNLDTDREYYDYDYDGYGSDSDYGSGLPDHGLELWNMNELEHEWQLLQLQKDREHWTYQSCTDDVGHEACTGECTDNRGHGCTWYAQSSYTQDYCGDYDIGYDLGWSNGQITYDQMKYYDYGFFNARQMCCGCGGGVRPEVYSTWCNPEDEFSYCAPKEEEGPGDEPDDVPHDVPE